MLTFVLFVWICAIVLASATVSASGVNSTVTLDEVRGYWWWTWSNTKAAPSDTNVGIAFSGWADVNQALSDSSGVYVKLPGMKILSIGGGNSNGRFTLSVLSSLNNAMSAGQLNAYAGISYDVEEGDAGLSEAFADSFSLAKQMGKTVFVTISHSAPYGIPDAASVMRSFLANSDIDYISPQLYTTGYELSNDFSTIAGVQWSEYASSKASIVPSIVRSSLYASAQQTFASYGVSTRGYIQWAQVM